MSERLEFTFTLYGVPSDDVPELAQHGEVCGFTAAFLGEHVLSPMASKSSYPYDANGAVRVLDPMALRDIWVSMGAMAAVTSTLKIGSGVYILPQRDVFTSALAAATVQNMAQGRFMFGIGVGWLREEYEVLGFDFDTRGSRMDEMIDVMRKLWTSESVSHTGKHFNFEDVGTVAPSHDIPLLIGGASKAALRRTGQLGDGWYGAPDLDLKQTIDIRTEVDRIRADAGRADLPFEYYVRMGQTPSVDAARQYADAGFRQLIAPTIELFGACSNLQERKDVISRLGNELVHPLGGTA